MKPLMVYVSVYDVLIVGLLGWKSSEARKLIEKKYGFYDDFESDGRCFHLIYGTKNHIIVFLKHWSRKPADLALYSHECLHASLLILRSIGQGINMGDHEHLTYLHQYIFQTFMEKRLECRS